MIKIFKRVFIPGVALTIFLMPMTSVNVMAMSEPSKEIDLTINNETMTIQTNAKMIEDILSEVKYEHKNTDKMNYELNDRVVEEMQVVISSEKEVNLSVQGEDIKTTTNASTVAELLRELDIKVGEDDIVIPSLDSKLNEDEEIVVINHEEKEYKNTKDVDYETIEKASFDIPLGETKVVQKGKKGEIEETYKKVSKNGVTVSDRLVSKETTKDPVNEEILIGTKEVVEKSINYKTVTKENSSMFKGETRVVQEGSKGVEQSVYKHNGEDRKLVSKKVTKKSVDKIIEEGTKEKPKVSTAISTRSSAEYSLSDLKFHGVINSGGKKYTYYSQSVLPGGGLKIPGRHVNPDGYVADKDGYIVVAANKSIPKGTVINTPFGYQGKVYDMCAACTPDWYDIYTK